MEKTETIQSHLGFGEHWNELPEYVGYVPEDSKSWQSLKDAFYASKEYSNERPLPVNIKKENIITVVNVYGFKIPEPPMASAFGSNTATKGRVALCKIVTTKQFVAIAW